MIETLWSFYKRGMRGFGIRLIATTHPYLSGCIALWVCYYSYHTPKTIKISTFLSTFVTYDTVVFGFTATAIALAIAIPSTTFLAFLSSERNGRSAFRDFLFILAWNGVVHILAFFILFPAILVGEEWAVDDKSNWSMWIYFYVLLWSQLYACMQFLVTTIGVHEMGDLYATYITKNKTRVTSETSEKK